MKYIDLDFLKFLLFDVHSIEKLLNYEKFSDFDKDSMIMFLDAAKDIADKEMYPYYQDFDRKPAKFEDGGIKIHPQAENIFRAISESGYLGAQFKPEFGGMNMPHLLAGGTGLIYSAANNHVLAYLALTVGSAHLIASFGTKEQADEYIPKMLSANWMGTMCLTEPEAGSSLGNLRTTATPTVEGYYKIKGQKIFISGGEHQFAENFVHMVLARIDGAPLGTKGISLFIVPKFRKASDGNLELNDVLTAGDYQKMGQKGYCTAHLMFGENDNCWGWLVGEANFGLKYMFQMMNEARLEVGLTGAAVSSAAFYSSLEYARERIQGQRLSQKGEKVIDQTAIINHPDVRRMLLMQRAVGLGSMSLILEAFKYYDLVHVTEGEEKENNFLMLDLLTPIAKAYPTEFGIQSTSYGVQTLGGYGYTVDFLQEQYMRDIRITSIYEGTTTIQSLDLLGRKITAQNGKPLLLLMNILNDTIAEAKSYPELVEFAEELSNGIIVVQKTIEYLLPFAFQQMYEKYLKDATLFFEMMGHVIISWQWLKIGIASLKAENNYPDANCKTNLLTLEYYINYELPKILSLKEIITKKQNTTIVGETDYLN
jgi:alkylation response protein AidB-like acyl-CoA dehydrogenase